MWKFYLPGGYFTSGNAVEFLLYAGSIGLSMPVACYNVYRGYKDKTGKMRPFFEASRPLFSPVILMIVTTLWVFLSPVDILEIEPRMFFYMVGTVFSHMCCRLIVAQMSSTRCDGFDWLLFPTTGLVLVSLVLRPGQAFELMSVYVLAIISTAAQIHYGVFVVRQMCRHFHIDCFRIKDRSD
jgi:ethanolaminephosphotransferase